MVRRWGRLCPGCTGSPVMNMYTYVYGATLRFRFPLLPAYPIDFRPFGFYTFFLLLRCTPKAVDVLEKKKKKTVSEVTSAASSKRQIYIFYIGIFLKSAGFSVCSDAVARLHNYLCTANRVQKCRIRMRPLRTGVPRAEVSIKFSYRHVRGKSRGQRATTTILDVFTL